MVQRTSSLVFLSHASVDEECAKLLQSWLHKRFRRVINVFISSDWESIELGGEWLEKITDAMKSCELAIVLASPNSLDRRWVHFEIGALKVAGKKVIPVCIGGVEKSDLPLPLERLQACKYDDAGDRLKLLQTISAEVGMAEDAFDRTDAEDAPTLVPPKPPPSPAIEPSGHGLMLERLFQTDDRWTTIVYTCRATFTGETCPGREPALAKTIAPHIPVDEVQAFSTAVNHFLPVVARRHEDDIQWTVICSSEAERLVREFPAVTPVSSPPALLDRDLVVLGENNFSSLLLHMAEPFQPWTGRQRDEIRHVNKPGWRSMVYAEKTPHALLDAKPLEMHSVGEGGGMISIFPNPFNFRRTVLNLYGCHREGQFAIESWLRGAEVETVVAAIAAVRGANDPRLDSIQIIVNRGGHAGPGTHVDPNPPSGAVPNLTDGRPFWVTRVNAFPPSRTIEINPHCDTQKPMYDISLIVELTEETQTLLREEVQRAIPDEGLYWEHEHCNIGFHVTLYEFCTHDQPSPEQVQELEATLATLQRTLREEVGPDTLLRRDAQIRGIELTHAALIAYVDFLPAAKRDMNWLETIRTWCDATVLRMAREKTDVQRLFNKRRVPFPPHVTLCRFREPGSPDLTRRVEEVTARRRYSVLAPVAIESLSLATAVRRPYQEVEVRGRYPLHGH